MSQVTTTYKITEVGPTTEFFEVFVEDDHGNDLEFIFATNARAVAGLLKKIRPKSAFRIKDSHGAYLPIHLL